MQFPCLLPRYNLRFSKGRCALYDLRLSTVSLLDSAELSAINMMDGSKSLDEINAWADKVMGREKIGFIMKNHSEKLITYNQKMQPAPHLRSLEHQLRYRSGDWPFSMVREESPYEITIGLTYGCNYQCIYCYQGETHLAGKTLSVAEWKGFIEQCADMGVQVISFTGGEPLLYNGLFELLEKAKERGIYCRVLTNGSHWANGAVKRLANNGVDYVHYSLPAVTEDLYDSMTRTNGNLEKSINTLREMKRYGIYVKAKMVLTPKNLCDVENVIHLCADCGVDEIFLAPFIRMSMQGKENIISPEDVAEVASITSRLEKVYKDRIRIDYAMTDLMCWKSGDDINKCGTVKDQLTILPNGDVGFCESLTNSEQFKFGNIGKNRLEDIWFSSKLDEPDNPKNVKEPCDSCEYLSFCKTGCLVFSYLDHGEYWGVDPRCFKSKSNFFERRKR